MKVIIIGFIAILVGVILAGEIATTIYENTEMPYNTIVNETWTLNSSGEASTFWVTDANITLAGDDVLASSIVIRNSNATSLTINTDYKVDSTDDDAVRIDILDSTATQAIPTELNDHPHSNQTFIGYNKYQDNYIRGSAVSRTLIKLINIFFAIAILSIGIWMVGKGLMDYIEKN